MKIDFENMNFLIENSLKDQWPFGNGIRNNTPYGLYANGSDSALAELILRYWILNKSIFGQNYMNIL